MRPRPSPTSLRWLHLLAFLLLLLPGRAAAFAPDGSTLDWLDAFGVDLPAPPHLTQVGPKGEASLAVPLALPPARLQPSLSLHYDARAGADRELPFGWRLGGLTEILRSTSPQAYGPNEWILAGPGFSGRLDCTAGPRCTLVHTTPDLAVEAEYDRRTDAWVVETSAGLTFELGRNDAAWTWGQDTARWRVTAWTDRQGNAVEVRYDADDRVQQLAYGGNVLTGEPHLVELRFRYDQGAAVRTNARAGFVEELQGSLREITLWMEESGSWAPQRAWELGWTAQPSESATLLDSLTVVGFEGSIRLAEPPTRFHYSAWAGTTTPASETSSAFGPAELSRVVMHEDRWGNVTEVVQESALVDLNGDGLRDHLETDGAGSWWVTWAERSPRGELHWTGGAQSFAGPPEYMSTWTRARFFHEQTTRLTDLNGDGLPDLVSTTAITGNFGTTWAVWYGDGAGFDAAYTAEAAPYTVLAHEDPWVTHGNKVENTLVDVDGDGWQDCLQLLPSGHATVAFHSGVRGGGWGSPELVDAPWCDDMGSDAGLWCGLSQITTELRTSNPIVTDTLGLGGLVDVNGDGLVDYLLAPDLAGVVGAPSGAPWTVYLGTGAGWESARYWTGPDMAMSWRSQAGQTADRLTHETLLDVDGDGLLDLVEMADRLTRGPVAQWYRNLGDGFDASPRATPSTWLMGLEATSLSEVQVNAGLFRRTEWVYTELAAVMDLDNDRQPDSLHLNTSSTVGGPVLEWGDYPGPHLLIEVDTGAGRLTELDWTPASTTWPAGDVSQPQGLHVPMDLVARSRTGDLVSGAWAQTTYDYYGGLYEDQTFQGFEGRDIARTASRQQLLVTEEDYALSLELPPELEARRVYTDACRSFAPQLQRCRGPRLIQRIEERQSWDWFGHHRLVDSLTVSQEGDDTGGRSTTKRWTVQVDYDSAGHLTWLYHDGGDGGLLDADLEVEIEWVNNGVLQRAAQEKVHGWDALSNTWREHRRRQWVYDHSMGGLSDGLLTDFLLSGFWHEAGETPSSGPWRRVGMQHGPRGEVIEAHDRDTGLTQTFTWTFGAALLETSDDGVTLTEHHYDHRGRPDRTDDLSNGVAREYGWDALDRPKRETVEDQTGASFLFWERSYQRSTLPFSMQERRYNEAGAVERESGAVFDGGGHAAVRWSSLPAGVYGVQGFTHDLWGQETSRTARCRSSMTPTNTSTSCGALSETWYDSMGQARVIDRDVNDPSIRVVENTAAWETRRTDEEGFLQKVRYDAYGRPVEVQQGREDSLTTLARYTYDPLGYLVAMTDEAGVRTTWSGDGASRVRAARSPDFGERLYSYLGDHLQRIDDSAGGWAEWQLDALGRAQVLELSDPLLGVATTTWTWDRLWVGAAEGATDPYGHEQRRFDALGRTTQRLRTWADGSQVTVDQGFDLEGRPAWTLTPSGRLMEAVRDAGFTTELLHATMSANAQLLVEADWDVYGRSKGWRSRSGVTVRAAHSPFGELESIGITGNRGSLASRVYQWQDNGLALSVDEGAGLSLYNYDDRMQLVGVVGPWTESFGFLPGGDVATQTTPSGQAWTWAPPAGHHKPTSRGSGSSLESFTWDNAGRLETWADGGSFWEFLYDGLSRLRAVMRDGQLALVIERDAEGQIIRRVEGNPSDPNAPVEQAFSGWRKTTTGSIREDIRVDGMLVGFFEDGQARWVMPEPGGAVAAVVDDSGTLLSSRTRSAYGATRSATGAQDAPGFHGHREELGGLPLIDAGARHLLLGLGMWLQPEPILLERPQGGVLTDPLRLHPYRYARNTPTSFHDPDGRTPDTIADGVFIVGDIVMVVVNPSDPTNWLALGADIVCLFVPGATGGGVVVRASAHADEVATAANALGRMASHGDDVARTGDASLDSARAMLGDGPDAASLNVTTPSRMGMNRAPRHHVMPQEHRRWFADRGVDIDDFTVRIPESDHQAIHAGRGIWEGEWNTRVMKELRAAESYKGSDLTSDEIMELIRPIMDEYGIPANFERYSP